MSAITHPADEAIEKFELIAGAGDGESTACVMSAVSWMAGEAWTDSPECAHRILRGWCINANDDSATTPEMRAELLLAAEQGVLDTWWVPTEVILGCLAAVEGEWPFERVLRAVQLVAWWKAVRQRPDLGDADLRGAYLVGAYLRDANLGDANLGDANLRGADLGGANLGDANLRDANLRDADLRGANLRGADLGGAYLGGADLRGAYLGGANRPDWLPERYSVSDLGYVIEVTS